MDKADIIRGNERLMKKLNHVYRSEASVAKFFKNASTAPTRMTNKKFKLADITEQNMALRKRIMERGPDPTIEPKNLKQWWKTTLTRMQAVSKYPLHFELEKEMKINSNNFSRCYFDLGLDNGVNLGRLVFELYNEICPKTCQHFISICKGTHENGLCYEGTLLHRIVTGNCIHGGITTTTCIGTKKSLVLDAENHIINHDRLGILSMDGRAESQYLITLRAMPEYDGRRVAFGRVVCGVRVLKGVENDFGTRKGRPSQNVRVVQCGQLCGLPCAACQSAKQRDEIEFELDDDENEQPSGHSTKIML
ncbi:peptidyl-prolyl cis-trans isomerase cyp11-like [Ctenocephalides felis]|uniref:peptidyl-prolyl cis-trans isomerase cyp11-like n=1 Tax=Ctenocephalides felis TaxID=7515 RepID=UPI000E6E12FA|nr:peptidyl-prolyl cis-trans isomerase cyp11-like [Ctenocephalides felis]